MRTVWSDASPHKQAVDSAWSPGSARNSAYSVVFDQTMLHLGRFSLLALVALCASAVSGASSAAADLAPGRNGSLTLIEQPDLSPPQSILYASTGSLGSGMSFPLRISERGDSVWRPQLAADGSGDAIAVWSAARTYVPCERYFCASVSRGVWYARRPAGGVFSAPHQLLAPTASLADAMVTMDPAGEAVIGYDDHGTVFIRRAPRNGSFGRPMHVQGAASLTYLSLDRRGGLLIVMNRGADIIMASLAAPHHAPGPSRVIAQTGCTERHATFCPGFGRAVVADGPRGDALIAWDEECAFSASRVQTAFRPAGGWFGPPQPLAACTPATPESGGVFPVAAVVDRGGHATVGLSTSSHGERQVEVSQADPAGSFSAPVVLTNRGTGTGQEANLATNGAGETAVVYAEGEQDLHSLFTVEARFSTDGKPFGLAKTMAAGVPGCVFGTGLGVSLAEFNEGCFAIPGLAGGEGHGFDAVYTLGRPLVTPSISDTVVRIQALTQNSVGPTSQVTLPAVVYDAPWEPQPASLIDLGTTAKIDPHGRLQGEAVCGNNRRESCAVQITITSVGRLRTVLARLHVDIPVIANGSYPLTITLDHAARSILRRHHKIKTLVYTVTTSRTGPPLRTNYPLNIVA
jgi:hypothetical protein